MSGSCSVAGCAQDGDSILPLAIGGESDPAVGVLAEYLTCRAHLAAIKGGDKYLVEDRGSKRILMGKDLPPVLKSHGAGGIGNVPVYVLTLEHPDGEQERVEFQISERQLEGLSNPIGKESLFKATPLAGE